MVDQNREHLEASDLETDILEALIARARFLLNETLYHVKQLALVDNAEYKLHGLFSLRLDAAFSLLLSHFTFLSLLSPV